MAVKPLLETSSFAERCGLVISVIFILKSFFKINPIGPLKIPPSKPKSQTLTAMTLFFSF